MFEARSNLFGICLLCLTVVNENKIIYHIYPDCPHLQSQLYTHSGYIVHLGMKLDAKTFNISPQPEIRPYV